MTSILAIDAAWTNKEPTGISLLKKVDQQWQCVALAPSYADFYALAESEAVDWSNKPKGETPDIDRLLSAASTLLDHDRISLITVDMPVSTVPITGRRAAESAISKAFGGMGCAAHSPSTKRPGEISTIYSEGCQQKGYTLGVTTTTAGMSNHLLEVYPHPALISLMEADYRLPYKASKSLKYWPGASKEERVANLLSLYNEMLARLATQIQAIPLSLPTNLAELSQLKRFEDAIDALVCGWVGMRYFAGEATPYGDETGAIWVPNASA